MNTPSPDTRQQQTKNSLGKFHGEAATSAMENAGNAYQSSSLIAAGASAQGVAQLITLVNLALSLLCVKAPAIIDKIGATKHAMLILTLISAITWLPLIAVLLIVPSASPLLVMGLWIINLIPTVIVTPLRDEWLATFLPSNSMGRYLGIRLAVSSISYLGTFYVMGYMLDLFNNQSLTGFAIIFSFGFIGTFLSFILYSLIHPPHISVDQKKVRFNFLDFVRETKNGKLGTFIVYVSLFHFSVNLCGPLYAVYMLEDLRFSYLTFTAIISAEYLARVLSASFWGKYADKAGYIKVIGVASKLIPFTPILWLFSSNVVYLVMVQLFAGTLWAAFDMCSQSYIYKAAPQDTRFRYIVYHKSLTLLFIALGTLSGAYLLSYMFQIFGSKILAMFLISGIFRFFVVKFMFHKIVDLTLGINERFRIKVDWSSIIRGPFKRGIFYRPHEWAHFDNTEPLPVTNVRVTPYQLGLLSEPLDLAPIEPKVEPEKKGIFYKPWEWSQVYGEADVINAPANLKAEPQKEGLFYRPQDWVQALEPIAEAMFQSSQNPEPYKQGLLYRPQDWAQVLEPIAEAMVETSHRAEPYKQGLFYRPQDWEAVLQPIAENMLTENRPKAYKQGLFYRPQDWACFFPPTPEPVTPKTRVRVTPSELGIKDLPKVSLPIVNEPVRAGIRAVPSKPPQKANTQDWAKPLAKPRISGLSVEAGFWDHPSPALSVA